MAAEKAGYKYISLGADKTVQTVYRHADENGGKTARRERSVALMLNNEE